jgi:hypothetical protein
MKNVKVNVIFDRLHDSLKNSRHNKVTRRALLRIKELEAAAEAAEAAPAEVGEPKRTIPKAKTAPGIVLKEHQKGTKQPAKLQVKIIINTI